MQTGIPYIKDPRLDGQRLVIYRSLQRFEKLKISYAGLYRTSLNCKDTLLQVRHQLADSSTLLLQHRQDLKLEKYNGWLYAQNAEHWKHKARRRNFLLFTLLTLIVGYETIHH